MYIFELLSYDERTGEAGCIYLIQVLKTSLDYYSLFCVIAQPISRRRTNNTHTLNNLEKIRGQIALNIYIIVKRRSPCLSSTTKWVGICPETSSLYIHDYPTTNSGADGSTAELLTHFTIFVVVNHPKKGQILKLKELEQGT